MTLPFFWVMDHYENLVKRWSSEQNPHMHSHLHTELCILMQEIQRLLEPSQVLFYPKSWGYIWFLLPVVITLGVRNDPVLTYLHTKFNSFVMFKYGVFNFFNDTLVFFCFCFFCCCCWLFLASFSIVYYHPCCKYTSLVVKNNCQMNG